MIHVVAEGLGMLSTSFGVVTVEKLADQVTPDGQLCLRDTPESESSNVKTVVACSSAIARPDEHLGPGG